MSSASEEPSDAMEGSFPEAAVHTKETCEQNKNQLESFKEIMMRNQQSLKKKEEEVQEYARRLSKIKSRAKLSRRSKEGASSSKDTVHSHKTEFAAKDTADDTIDDISQAKTPKAKSSLLQRKLAENRKAFEQRSKELTETKRVMEEKVEAIRQQLDETDLAAEIHKDQLAVTPIRPLVITSDVMTPVQIQDIQEKENKIMDLNSKIVKLEATILDLQENLKEKDSVIDSKTKAVTLMSADLSRKGKTTLDTLEDTKDEMRTMQENFILIETSLKNKNVSLLKQLQERDSKISELEHTINRFEERFKEQKIAETVSADFSRSTMDTLAETKDAMKSMQENFVLIESSLKLKNDNLLQQLGEYEVKLGEAKERIFQLESGAGIVTTPAVEDLQFKIEKLEQNNRQLLDEKYEMQKNVAELQAKIISSKSTQSNGAIIEKDNRIAELENLIEELKQSNELLKEESKTELQKQVTELSSRNEEYSNKIIDLEKQVHTLETEKNDIASKLSAEQTTSKDDIVIKLTKELEDLNKGMIKLKAQHRSKVKNLQKQLEDFKMVSDTNAELVRLGNQVALLEEEKGNLQLSLVDFDELKASAGDWQERVADLESKVSSQTKEIQMHIDAIATLENQKLDLMQELHTVKQEVLALEAENAESENLRVTAEMKVVELEEQLEAAHKEQSENKFESASESEYHELLKKLDALTQENSELYSKLNKMEEKGASDTGSTESFEAIQVNDRNDLLKKIEDLEQKNNELTLKLTKLEEKDGSHAGSTESFETINDGDRSELLKKIEQLTQENSDLTMKLSRIEEKGSSDTGSTESFERIPEHDSVTKIELLTQENNELVIKLTKLEEQLSQIECGAQLSVPKVDSSLETLKDGSSGLQVETLTQENDNLMANIAKLKTQVGDLAEENNRLQDRIETLTMENTELVINRTKLEEHLEAQMSQMSIQIIEYTDQIKILMDRQQVLEKELTQLREASVEQSVNITSCETDDAKSKIVTLEKDNAQMIMTITQLEEHINNQKEELSKITKEKEELNLKLEHMTCDDFARERLELIDKLENLYREKESVVHERQELHEQISTLLQKSSDEMSEMRKTQEAGCEESQTVIVASLERELENSKILIAEYKNQVEEMNMKLQSMEAELQKKAKQLLDYEASDERVESLQHELRDMSITAEEWKFKYDDMQVKMQAIEQNKISIEEAFKTLENDNKELLEAIKEKDAATFTLQEQFQATINSLETRLQDEMANITVKEDEIMVLKTEIEKKEQELHIKYAQLQNGMITIDSLQDELNNYSIKFKENEATLSSSLGEIVRLNDIIKQKEEDVDTLTNNISKITEALEHSKSLEEFNEILESLRNKETNYIELQDKHEEVLRENNELLQKIEDMSKDNENIKNELIKKEEEINSLLVDKKNLDAQIEEIKNDKTETEKRLWELDKILNNQTMYAENIQSELSNEYKQMELLRIKHREEMEMMKTKLEEIMEELIEKIKENEAMKAELEKTNELLEKSVTEEMKTILEGKITDLEEKLSESENKLQMQSEKMKKIVATFNKKKIACQELEARVAELEEKWSTEKDEKEVKNKQIQEVEISMREKDNKIADLEEKLLQTKNDTAEALANSEKIAKELASLKEKMAVLMEHNTEMGDEIEKQRAEIERISLEMGTEKAAKENITSEYELYKQTTSKENEQKQAIMDVIKEEARELSVRMQVMETEYVAQLATIKNLQAENGLLSSKQAQIDEKLENAEKESEDRRLLIEQLQKEIATMTMVAAQSTEQDVREDDTERQHCDHSEQCQNYVKALEARLQERQAEIENLNNELANSYGNIVLLHDQSQRYNDMMMQERMNAQEHFNQSLMETNTLQQEIDALRTERSMSEQKMSDLESELEEYKRRNEEDKIETAETAETSVIESQQLKQDTLQSTDAAKNLDTILDAEKEIERLQSLLNEKENQCLEQMKEINLLLKNIEEGKLHIQDLQTQFENSQGELKRVEHLLSEKDAQLESLNTELNKVTSQLSEHKVLQEQYRITQEELERLQQLVVEKNVQADSLIAELNAVNQQMTMQSQQYADIENNLRTEISLKDVEVVAIREELAFTKETVQTLITERDQQNHTLETYKFQIDNLTAEAKNVNDNDSIRETSTSWRNLQIELENALRERDQAQALIANLRQALDDSQQSLQELRMHKDSLSVQQESGQVLTAIKEPIIQQESVQTAEAPIEKEAQDTQLDIGLGWDQGSEPLVDEEAWGWNTEDAQLINEPSVIPLIPSVETQLRVQVEDLQDRIKNLEMQNAKIAEENKMVQIKSAKLVKKLKEYKAQVESLQQQLKMQKQTDSFFDLDTAIEEELKTQITNLEKALNEIKEEKKNIIADKEALLKRLDVITSANERYMEMKERQDMEVEVLRIQNKELSNKVQSLEWQLQENTTEDQIDPSQETDQSVAYNQTQKKSVKSVDNFEEMSKKYKEEIDDLKDELEALAAENEQLQHFLEEQKAAITNLESKNIDDNSGEFREKLDALNKENTALQSALTKSKEEYDMLRKQYEQSLIDANDQVTAMRQNSDFLKAEFMEKIDKLEAEINNLQTNNLQVLEEKDILEGKISALMNSEEKLSIVNTSLMEVTELLNIRVQEVADLKQELQVQYVEKQQAEATLQSEIENLTKELDERKRELGALKEAFTNKEHELIQQRSVETVNTIISEATQELVQKHAIEIEEKDKELRDLMEKLTAMQTIIDEYTLKLQDNEAKLETQQQQIIYLKEDLTERNSIIGATQADANLLNEKLREKQQELIQYEEEKTKLTKKLEDYLADIQHLQIQLNASETSAIDLQECNSHIHNLRQEIQVLRSEKESILLQYDQEMKAYQTRLENDKEQIDALKQDLREKTKQLHYVNTQLCTKENDLEGIKAMMNERDSLLEIVSQELNEKRAELERLRDEQSQNSQVEGLPASKRGNDDNAELQKTVDELRAQIERKHEELEHLKYVLSEQTYPAIIQELQDNINCLYNEKTTLEASLQAAMQTLTEKQEQVHVLTQRVNEQEHISKEEAGSLSKDRRSAHDQEEIVRLQNELHRKEQEINELRYVIAEKDSQLSLQASMEPQSDDFELRENMQRLTGELYGKEQEVRTLKSTVVELQEKILHLKEFERLSEESRNAVERLVSEKEQIRIEAEEFLKNELRKKESEIGEIKLRLSEENQTLLAELQLKGSDIENLKMQLEQLRITADDRSVKLSQKEAALMHSIDDLAEKERRLVELSITKDAEFHNLKMQILEKEARIKELLALSAEEERQLDELRHTLATRETEMDKLKKLLEEKVSEYELIQHALKKDVSVVEAATPKSSETIEMADNKESTSNELDLALYMLHQRDVRCEELTLELMQLLEERDTLQLRLSNAIRINEEMRRIGSAEASPMKDLSSASQAAIEPLVEQPSPSKSEGPVEIAKEAIDIPIEDKEALALKLSQLHSVSHAKDVRLKDERELRHTQQMSLLAHRDVLSTLPPEAAARLVNANYTLSRDVQSQSSVLLNWLWGKSTPKVVHM